MDLSTLDTSALANEGAVLHLNGPTGQPLFQDGTEKPITITLLGEDSDVVTKANAEAANRYLRSMTGPQQITAEASKANEIKKFAAATVAWDGIVVEGKALQCDAAAAAGLYRKFPWIADQVRLFIGDRAHFIKASPTA